MNLEKELQAHLDKGKNRPQEIKEVMRANANRLIEEKVGKDALKKGDYLKGFTLNNALGQPVNILDFLKEGPIILTFYRGGWCPYCNLELRAYNEILDDIHLAGGRLVAISPELPDLSMSLTEKHGLKYEVLTDLGNELARELGLVFRLDDALVEVYKGSNIDLMTSQGNEDHELPIPATYVIGKDGEVVLSYINTDYTKRLEPSVALEALKGL